MIMNGEVEWMMEKGDLTCLYEIFQNIRPDGLMKTMKNNNSV
jgi:hypothetical protein